VSSPSGGFYEGTLTRVADLYTFDSDPDPEFK
jgi:hypothetical protein